jgi:hypothetical protein
MAVFIPITYQQSNRLKAALGLIYNTSNKFGVVLSRVGQSYNLLEKGTLSYVENILSIVRIAAMDGWLMQLITEVLVDVPDPDVKQIQQELRPVAAAAMLDPFQVCRLTGSYVMIDRTDLRKYVRAMARPTGKRLLVVKGPRRSGRSHTVQLLSYLEQQHGGFTLVPIDLESFARATGMPITSASNESPIQVVTQRPHGFTSRNTLFIEQVAGNTAANGLWTITVTGASQFLLNGSAGNGVYVSGGTAKLQTPVEAWHIAEKLVNLLRYREVEIPESPLDGPWSTWVQDFCDNFEGEARRQALLRMQPVPQPPLQIWIVIDAFHSVLLAQSAVDLIRELANRINSTLYQFRMVLLGFEDSLPAGVMNHLEEEAIRKIGEDEIIEFFGLAFREMLLPEDQEKVAELVESVLREAKLDDPDFLTKLGSVASRELSKLETP